ncbi:MAG: ATP-dependent DNA ligase [Deltaproteobacteria bacterium]|nr:MAG: ATP-dependent DNA ligase [Deltaproteobacteria bacterium]TMB38207.1 MAG: ATP-dependent DNA ligase [Deltaproteobacteria bacterium]
MIASGRDLRITSLDKVLWPETGFTKGDLIDWYSATASLLLPHLARHPIMLGRWPEGVDGRGFYQSNCPKGAPEWIATVEAGGARYCLLEEPAALVWAANLATLEIHPLHLSVDRPSAAGVVLFDLDPGEPAGLIECCDVALLLRERLARDGLAAFVKASAAKGLHLVAPLDGSDDFERAKAYARDVATELADVHPALVTAKVARNQRGGRIYVDWAQNDPLRSTIAPYSLRATSKPGVSMPLRWEEIERAAAERRARGLWFSPQAARERLETTGDLFATVLDAGGRLPANPGGASSPP